MSSSRRIIRTCTIVAAATALLLLSTRDAGAAPNFERDVRPVLEKYCYTCHNPKKLKGDLDLTRVKSNAQAKGAAKLFNKLYLPIREREMPPEGAKQIPEELRQTFQHWIDQLRKMEDTDCTKLATDDSKNFYRGFVMSRRINRVEYDFTVRDLFGLPHELGVGQRLFPKDGSGGLGFDNVGDALFTSPVLMEKYLQAADEVLATALPDGGEPAGLASRFTREQLRDARRRVFVEWPGYGVSARSAARQILETFAYRAFRRPVTKQEIDKLLTLFDKADARGDSFEASVKLALKGVLISPHFLFRVEMPVPGEVAGPRYRYTCAPPQP